MKVHHWNAPPPDWLGAALERFENQFRYPLGQDRWFRIAHGRDYMTFFNAMGEGHLFAVEREGRVLGTLVAVLRSVRFASGEIHTVSYLCDLKVESSARYGRTLSLLMNSARETLEKASVDRAYGVVMDGTGRTPERYTGRAGTPPFAAVGKLTIVRIPTGRGDSDAVEPVLVKSCALEEIDELNRYLNAKYHLPLGGRPAQRSAIEPMGLRMIDGSACGVLEDTRRGKRLFDGSGDEMRSAHFTRFAFRTMDDGLRLLRAVLPVAQQLGFPAVFTAVQPDEGTAILKMMPSTILAPATVFACGLESETDGPWRIDTSEV